MDYYPLTLRSLIDPNMQLSERNWLQLMCGIANRLVTTHSAMISHGDLCPSNGMKDSIPSGLMIVLVNAPVNFEYDPNAMLVSDFGVNYLTQLVDAAGQIRVVPGSLVYMAPEIRSLNRPDATPESDMWSVGVIGYELAIGHELETTNQFGAPLEAYFQGQELDLSLIPNWYSAYVHQIIRDCLHRDPAQRISAANLCNRIQQLLASYPPQPPPVVMPGGWQPMVRSHQYFTKYVQT